MSWATIVYFKNTTIIVLVLLGLYWLVDHYAPLPLNHELFGLYAQGSGSLENRKRNEKVSKEMIDQEKSFRVFWTSLLVLYKFDICIMLLY
jgi:hypothetical protein